MTNNGLSTIGLIGAGHIGSQLARLAIAAGYDVVVSNSRGADTLQDLVTELGPHARAATPAEAARAGDLVVVTIPLRSIDTLPVAELAGKIVVDTNNYYPQRDGAIAALDDETSTSAELLQDRLPESHVVKAFNHIYASALTTDGQPAGSENRRALIVASDDPAAAAAVSALQNQFGYDTVNLGPLAEGWRIQPGTPGYGPRLTSAELLEATASARRANSSSAHTD